MLFGVGKMGNLKSILKICVVLALFPVVILLVIYGKESLILDFIKINNKKKKELEEEQILVDQAIRDLEKGLENKKKTELTHEQVENYHEDYFKNNK
jgi:hypothetical protein